MPQKPTDWIHDYSNCTDSELIEIYKRTFLDLGMCGPVVKLETLEPLLKEAFKRLKEKEST